MEKRLFIRRAILGVAVLPFLCFAVFLFFSAFSKSNMLVGWDTPAYLYSVRILAQEGLQNFLRFWEYNRFTYSLILFPFYLIWPGGFFTIAVILPILLAFLLAFLIGAVLFHWFKDSVLAFLGVSFSFVWIAPYVLASNLFAQLLGFILGLTWLAYAFQPQTKEKRILFYLVFLLAAITHVYTMIFLYVVFILSNFTAWIFSSKNERENNSKKQIVTHCLILGLLVVFPLFLSTFLMNSTRVFGTLLNPQQIAEWGARALQISPDLLFVSLGANLIFVVPMAFVFVLASFVRSKGLTEKLKYSFILLWIILTIAFPFVSYLFPPLASLTERMIIIAPIPILLAVFAKRIPELLISFLERKSVGRNIKRVVHSPWRKGTILSLTLISLFAANINPILKNSQIYLNSFVSPDAANRLEYLSQNMQFVTKPLFVIGADDAYDEYWDNMIGAYVGPHYTYIGSIQNLVNFKTTIFNSTPSNIMSQKYFDRLNDSGVLSYDGLSDRSIILIDDFYTLRLFETFYVQDFSDGIHFVNFEKLWTDRNELQDRVFIDAFADIAKGVGVWYGMQRNWSFTPLVLELYSNVTGNEYVSYPQFYISESGNFSIEARYFDFSGYNTTLSIRIDDIEVGLIEYTGKDIPIDTEIGKALISNGWHQLSVHTHSTGMLMIDLDYIVIRPR